MRGYIIGRLALNVPVILFVVTLVFLASHAMPDYATQRVAQGLTGGGSLEEAKEQIRHDLGLDKPLWKQYGIYLADLLKGDLGESLLTKRPVVTELKDRLPPSIELGILQFLIAAAVSIPIGVISAIRQDTWVDYLLRFFAILGVSIPSFFLAILLLVLSVKITGWTPPLTIGQYRDFLDDPARNLQAMALPAIAGGVALGAGIMRLLRSQMLEVLREDYVRTAWAKGLRERTIVMRHVLRNAMVPVITLMGLAVGALFSGEIVLETIFSIPGMGLFMITSVKQNDFPVAQGIVLVIAVALVFTNLVVDLAYGWLDPRVRYE